MRSDLTLSTELRCFLGFAVGFSRTDEHLSPDAPEVAR